MKKRISYATQGQQVNAGDYSIIHILPNRLTDAVGPFVHLDLLIPLGHSLESPVLHYILHTDVGHTHGCLPSTACDLPKKVLSGESGWLKAIAVAPDL